MKLFSRAKRPEQTDALRVVGRTAYQLGLVAGTRFLDYRDTTDYENDQRELLLMLEDERLDQRLGDTPEWTI